jgi:hypothetical protein
MMRDRDISAARFRGKVKKKALNHCESGVLEWWSDGSIPNTQYPIPNTQYSLTPTFHFVRGSLDLFAQPAVRFFQQPARRKIGIFVAFLFEGLALKSCKEAKVKMQRTKGKE